MIIMGTDKRQKVRMDIISGFSTRVNLFIIRHIYRYIKKAEYFILRNESKRPVTMDIKDITGFTRKRLNDIYNGQRYDMYRRESEHLAELFNINENYFRQNGWMIDIHGLTQEDWKCYFYENHHKSVEKPKLTDSERKNKSDAVKNALDDLVKDGHIPDNYDKTTAVYHIYYYFSRHETYRPVTELEEFLNRLDKLKISDWKEIIRDPGRLEKYHRLLQMHTEYTGAYLKIHNIEHKTE